MKIHGNVVLKNESLLLTQILPQWNKYPIDEWIIYDDNSTDDSIELIKKTISSKVTVINDKRSGEFNETYCRDRMLEYSRKENADIVIALDADEVLSTNFVEIFNELMKEHLKYDIHYFWYNLVDDVNHYRQDPSYINNYKSFIMPVKKTGSFKEYPQINIHCPRTAPIGLPKLGTSQFGLLHFQSINVKFYALKQLWYKHWEHIGLGQSVHNINKKYDSVVNDLNFNKTKIDPALVKDISFDKTIYDSLLKIKQYEKYIADNKNEDLITFGKQYL
jgi:glycosyltransferase involved in cell wall biosynthesis